MIDLTNATCGTCLHWERPQPSPTDEGEMRGDCKLKAPQFAGLVMTQDQCCGTSWVGVWPSIYASDWCGEHPTRRAAAQLLFEAELERLRKEQTNGGN